MTAVRCSGWCAEANPQARTVLITGHRSGDGPGRSSRRSPREPMRSATSHSTIPELLETLGKLAGATSRGSRPMARSESMADSPPLDILVIEDDADTRENLRDILELDDHRVSSGGQRRRGAGPRGLGEFSAIILDRRLPDADGRGAHASPPVRGPRRRRDRRHRLRRPPGRDRRPATGGDRLYPQADQRRTAPDQPCDGSPNDASSHWPRSGARPPFVTWSRPRRA